MTNPYEPPHPAKNRTVLRTRFVWTSTLLASIAIAAALIDVPSPFQDLGSFLMTLLFLLCTLFCCWAEWFGTLRSKRFVTLVLAPVALITIVIVNNFLDDVLHGFSFKYVVDNPTPILGWLACPVVWYYIFASYRHRWILPASVELYGDPRVAEDKSMTEISPFQRL